MVYKEGIITTKDAAVSHCVPFQQSKADAGIRVQGKVVANWLAFGSKQVDGRQPTAALGQAGRSQVADPGDSGSRQVSHHEVSDIQRYWTNISCKSCSALATFLAALI